MIEQLRLRTKIVLIPILCVVVVIVLGSALISILTKQRAILDDVAGTHSNRSQTAIDVFSSLSSQHLTIVDILASANHGNVDEEKVYEDGEKSLAALADIEAVINEIAEMFSQSDEEIALVQLIERNLTHYKISASSAIEMSTVDVALAAQELISANISYDKLNRNFLRLIDVAKADMAKSLLNLSQHSQGIQSSITLAVVLGITTIAIVSLIVYLSISKTIKTLSSTMLALAGGTLGISIPSIRSDDELAEMAMSLDVFRRNAEELQIALGKERELNGLQRQFVSMVSHEFRTPLAIIDGSAQRMLRGLDKITPDRLETSMNKVRNSVVRLTGLMESVLSAARLEEGRITFEPGICVLTDMLKDMCESYAELNADRKLILDIERLPKEITADAKLLQQVFSNLLSNAVKYSPRGTRIWVSGHLDKPNSLVISVRDEGVGIPEAELQKLFERFFRASTSTGIAGSGIGLHLVKHFIDLHNGTVDVESYVNGGTTFTVRMPFIDPASSGAKRAA